MFRCEADDVDHYTRVDGGQSGNRTRRTRGIRLRAARAHSGTEGASESRSYSWVAVAVCPRPHATHRQPVFLLFTHAAAAALTLGHSPDISLSLLVLCTPTSQQQRPLLYYYTLLLHLTRYPPPVARLPLPPLARTHHISLLPLSANNISADN